MGMHQIFEGERERREYSRVEAYLPFDCRVVAPDEKDHIQSRISGNTAMADPRPNQDMGDYDPVLGEWLKILNAKIDTVIRLITLQREGYFGLPFKAVNISGGGMSFSLPQGIPMGDILEIKIMLTWHQPLAMSLYGEIVKSEPRNGSYFTAVRYVYMDEFVRDEIIRFVFEREREIIREKRG